MLLFLLLLFPLIYGGILNEAIFSEESILEWDPYKVNLHCPRFVEASVGNEYNFKVNAE